MTSLSNRLSFLKSMRALVTCYLANLRPSFAITELLVKSNVLEEGTWFLRLANNIPFASEESPAGAVQYSMRSHYAEVSSIEVGAEATEVSLNGNRLAFLRLPVQTASETLSVTFSPAYVQRYCLCSHR
jgi:hypothetical protein